MKFAHEVAFARRVARAAGENAIRIRAGGITAESKADDSPVTIADKDNERLIREAIEAEFPDDGILGEEGSSRDGVSGRRWIIDPIDGTRDFVRGNRFWCVLIGLEQDGESVAGVAHFPLLNELYWAAQGEGAYLARDHGDDRLRVSSAATIEESVFCPNALHLKEMRPHLEKVLDLTQRCWSYRAYGGALDACMLASGQTDIWFEPKVAPWDLAALKLILEEAGAAYFALDGTRSIYAGTAVACTPGLAGQVRRHFNVPG